MQADEPQDPAERANWLPALMVVVTARRPTAAGGTYAHAADRDQLDDIYHKIDALETRKAELNVAIAAAEMNPPMPALHPNMAEVFKEKAAALAAGLEQDD